MTDRIAELEHDANEYVPAIRPLGADPDHCDECKAEVERRERQARIREMQANCPHPDSVELRTFCSVAATHLCTRCGARLAEDVR